MDSQKQAPADNKVFDAAGKVVLITGGVGGFGQAFVRALLEKGAKVCMADVNANSGNKVLEDFSAEFGGDKIRFCVCDVTKDDSFKAAFEFTEEAFGPIDILINNAGIGNEQNWKLTMDVNLGGAIRGTELAIEHMRIDKGHKGGHVINISSISGLKVIPFGPYYSASKAGIVQFTRTAGHAFHFGFHGVNIRCLCPSLVDTPFLTQGSKTSYSPQSAAAVQKLFGSFPIMGTDELVLALWQLLEDSKPGSALVVVKGQRPWYCDASIP